MINKKEDYFYKRLLIVYTVNKFYFNVIDRKPYWNIPDLKAIYLDLMQRLLCKSLKSFWYELKNLIDGWPYTQYKEYIIASAKMLKAEIIKVLKQYA